jgi:hypothetical protein
MKNDLDPFRVALGVISGAQRSSDLLVAAANVAGLKVDLELSQAEGVSNSTRIRALIPRILNAYDALDDQQRLSAAKSVVSFGLSPRARDISEQVVEALETVGWEIHDGELSARTPELREMFFPKGTQWDAFVVLRDLFGEAKNELTIVDSYADKMVFQLLDRAVGHLSVKILCSRYAPAVKTEASAFTAQHPGTQIEVRSARDFHDRFVVIDGKSCVHVGASINHAGNTAFMISRVEDVANQAALLSSINTAWLNATILP